MSLNQREQAIQARQEQLQDREKSFRNRGHSGSARDQRTGDDGDLVHLLQLDINDRQQQIYTLKAEVRSKATQITSLTATILDRDASLIECNNKLDNLKLNQPNELTEVQKLLTNMLPDYRDFSDELFATAQSIVGDTGNGTKDTDPASGNTMRKRAPLTKTKAITSAKRKKSLEEDEEDDGDSRLLHPGKGKVVSKKKQRLNGEVAGEIADVAVAAPRRSTRVASGTPGPATKTPGRPRAKPVEDDVEEEAEGVVTSPPRKQKKGPVKKK